MNSEGIAPCLYDIEPFPRLSPANRLLADYLADHPALRHFFPHRTAALASFENRAGIDRRGLAWALAAAQTELGAHEAAIANATSLASPETRVITVGQQPGLLTGPAYTPFKALTAINLARRLERETGCRTVPVFWVGADDDDRGEADHCGWWDREFALHEIRYPAEGGYPGQLVGDLPLGIFGAAVLAQVEPLLAGTPCGDEVRCLLRETLAASRDLGEWFCRLLSGLLSSMGLVICDARLPIVRKMARDVFAREIDSPLLSTELVNAQARALEEAGYRPPLHKPADVCNFFIMDGERRRVTFSDKSFYVGKRKFSCEEMRALLAAQPERFLPNAVLRPVVQEFLFGSSAFVAGPNEIGYWAQLAPVFAALGVKMPPVALRASATILPAWAARALRDWHMPPIDLLDAPSARRQIVRQAHPEVDKAFTAASSRIYAQLAELSAMMTAIDPTLQATAAGSGQRIRHEISRLEEKTLKAVERREAALTERFERVTSAVRPGGGTQERTLNLLSVLAWTGLAGIEVFYDLLDGQEGKHLFVELHKQ